MQSLTLTCVTKRMPHHGAHAGYSALIDHLCPARVVQVPLNSQTRWIGALTRRLNPGRPPGSDWWGAPSLWAELSAMQGTLRGHHVVHVMYGEDLLGVSSYLASARRRVVATFHQPMTRIEALHVPMDAVRRLDALIVLDEAAAEDWRERCPGLAVHALRLSVDTGFWRPPERAERRRSCLVVGGHLRDLEVLSEVVAGLSRAGVQVDLVGVPPHWAQEVCLLPGVHHHVRISDEALLELYQGAGAFLLAMRAASGNNALLQALATGCPVISTDLEGVRSYLPREAALWATPGRAQQHLDAALQTLEDQAGAEARVALAQAHVQGYSLPAVAAQHWRVYRSLG